MSIQSKFSAFRFLQSIYFGGSSVYQTLKKFPSHPFLLHTAQGVLPNFINDLLSQLFSSQDVLDKLSFYQDTIADGLKESAVAMWVSSSAEMTERPGNIMPSLELRYPKISLKLS